MSVQNGVGWKCWSHDCGAGDGVDLIRRLRFNDESALRGRLLALRHIAPAAGVTLPLGRWAQKVSRWAQSSGYGFSSFRYQRERNRPKPLVSESTVRLMLRESHDAMRLGPLGRDYLTGRGFDPGVAERYGFRSIETQRDWQRIGGILSAHTGEERDYIGLGRLPFSVPAKGSGWQKPGPLLVIPYHAPDGVVIGWRLRAIVEGALGYDGTKAIKYKSLRNVSLAWPFGAVALAHASGNEVHIAEGELSAYSLSCSGLRAIGIPGVQSWRPEWTDTLSDATRVVTWFDDDAAGEGGRKKLRQMCVKRFGRFWALARYRDIKPRTTPSDRFDVNDAFQSGDLEEMIEAEQWND